MFVFIKQQAEPTYNGDDIGGEASYNHSGWSGIVKLYWKYCCNWGKAKFR